jgi:regulator of replication initiation timing
MKACTNKPMNGAKLGAWVAELEDNNAKLVAELEQAHQALKEAVVAQNSLSVSHEKLEEECTGVRAVVDAFEQEKAKTATDHEAEVAAAHKYF